MRAAAVLGIALALAAPPAAAGDVEIAEVVADPTDVTRAVLVGPSGQVYEPDGGRWVRRAEGGVAADVGGAARAGGELVVAGIATPLYRRDGSTWFALRLGQEGRTVLGAGPTPAVAIGKQVFVHAKGRTWTRVGALPGAARAVWASGKTVWAATDLGVFRLKGRAFVKAGPPVDAIVGAAGVPWGLVGGGLRHLPSGKDVPVTIDGVAATVVAATGAGKGDLIVVADVGGKLVLARAHRAGVTRIDDVPLTGAVAGLAVDADGDALVAFAGGAVAVRAGEAWTTAAAEDELPSRKPGPGPSRTR